MSTIIDAALQLHAAGASVVPVKADGSKSPALAWKSYTRERATEQQIRDWFPDNTPLGVGMITGAISGGIELLEIEGRAMPDMPALLELLDGAELTGLYQQILQGWSEQSPSGGLHLFYRISDAPVPGNEKIARADNRETLAETRGEGGFVVLAPSAGTVHPTGRPYVRLLGGPDTITTITMAQRDQLHLVFNLALDKTPEEEPWDSTQTASIWDADFGGTTTPSNDQPGDLKPGDDYEQRTDWADILTPAGWTLLGTRGRTRYWRRPGKDEGISATTGHADDRDRLYVFSTSTEFEAEKPYTKFGAYALLQHGGDHSAAARTLHADGYGKRAPRELTPRATASASAATGKESLTIADAVQSSGNPGTLPTDHFREPAKMITEPAERPALSVVQGGRTTASAAPAPATTTGEDDDLTDTGNARLAAQEHSTTLKYIPDAGKWATWENTRWQWQPDQAAAIQAALDIADRLPDVDKQTHAHRLKSLSARSLSNAVAILKTMPDMRVAADRFDRQPYQLNTPDGAIDLRTGAHIEPLPTLFHSKQTRVSMDDGQPTPLWSTFLEQTFEGDQQMITYVQRLTGLSAIGEVLENILPFLHGSGGNGKTVFLETITSILGEYATETPPNFLLAGRDRHETELANLQGRRMAVASEINEGTRFDEAKVKMLTGGDKITARFMRQDFFTFTPSHTLWLMGNSQPKVETGGDSFWRRLRLIPFVHTVTPEQRVENLQERLIEHEGAGILAWIVQGAVDYLAHGLDEPDAVRAATQEYKQEEDHLGRYAAERIHTGGGDPARVLKSEIRADYITWCATNGEHELNVTAFGRALKQKLPELGEARSNGRHYFTNLTLLDGDSIIDGEYWNK
ncbi:phage/plasmid primase, P4 family [Pseudoclavibacter sp. CFCC 11306]|uniref:phage/plasmid primase, P4 family n=1 Tax=Pseudoclavibacter sp. CFCC 11306 TaxID=1564493 RepID=UPI0013016A33|nr:phage/plasmid primase, P4 family [Pseudoclavibacter sp. CFCC 11306]KAB1658993.1 DNA primase [Pseudoclavibacter sp. CFCC 11306]